ncbi:DegT/DnrJ/EryC1/StrS family aminotransferase [Cyclobacterium marinum]|uniref:DegT/DnrJ/EryC1/StrS aminotransferase n=1 Tax=Cyclobacterium marinum (strain ATCC 25205 / DSM 745 / LMG 13164 / NCIMB 1802) TaxID=880070 RepID=G0J678_CYCMS|nr:DegT/DnrJ/EryC1/StrS family aminotransferase [Cyclobacterium marinum]AEL26830.1 DegT/DnrJ/EryC1/StrS aminotransferase [Cyclobacterium marinum DSM 745]MBI0400172.1 DegT/DnrJ/EryC1/StrS family aminotransferase [Cyclobacterium marinum]|tara:strand:+ start:25900 stop:27066 length:1167 start_codon:yes stop_codon:yes gene_type:complete
MTNKTGKIYLSSPQFTGEEIEFVNEAIAQEDIATNGVFIRQFEEQLENRFNSPYAVALNSGTSAIHLSLHLLRVGTGDEVICQSFTYIATTNPILYLGGTPIFVDSEKDTWNMCPLSLEHAIKNRLAKGKKPKAIIVVNLFGMPANWPEISRISRKYDIPVLEDAAESVGSKIGDRFTGTFGDLAIYSFNGNKIISTGGGGALLTNNRFWDKNARYLSTQAKLDFPYFEHMEMGFNYKMNNLSAGIGLAQLAVLDERIERRRGIYDYYKKHLEMLPGISFLKEPQGYFSNRWLTTMVLDPSMTGFQASDLRELLLSEGIESRFLWKPMHLQPMYRSASFFGSETAEKLFIDGICLPSGSGLSNEQLNRVIHVVFRLHKEVAWNAEKSV